MGSLVAVVDPRTAGSADAVVRGLASSPHRGSRTAHLRHGPVDLGVSWDDGNRLGWLARVGPIAVALQGRLDVHPGGRPGRPDDPARELADAWAAHGATVLPRLRGAFSAVITDGRSVWAARDHLGNRALYQHTDADRWVLGTEPKQVLAAGGLERRPNLEHLERVLFGGIDRSTALRGIERVPRRTVIERDPAGRTTSRVFWDPTDLLETDRRGYEEAVEGLWFHLEQATHRSLSGRDVLQLSGGLDSTAIAACTTTHTSEVHALTAIYPDHPTVDESSWTRSVAEHLGMPLTAYVPTAGGLDDIQWWVEQLDGPIDVASIPEVAESYERSAALGASTVLDGQAAEFLLAMNVYTFDHLLAHGRLRAAARIARDNRAVGRPWRAIVRAAARTVTPPTVHRWRLERRPVSLPWVAPWIEPQRILDADGGSLPLEASAGPRSRWGHVQVGPLSGASPGFEADDVIGATYGVEVRRPFNDVDLWEFVLGLRAEVRYPDARTKSLLRDAMRGHLPHAVVDRTDKTVFDDAMLADADYPALRKHLGDDGIRVDGIDYGLLQQRLQAEDLTAKELVWARDLAKIHAFLRSF